MHHLSATNYRTEACTVVQYSVCPKKIPLGREEPSHTNIFVICGNTQISSHLVNRGEDRGDVQGEQRAQHGRRKAGGAEGQGVRGERRKPGQAHCGVSSTAPRRDVPCRWQISSFESTHRAAQILQIMHQSSRFPTYPRGRGTQRGVVVMRSCGRALGHHRHPAQQCRDFIG